MTEIPQFTTVNYSQFFGAGALCCLLTHGAMTPIDVIKTRIQIDPELKGKNMIVAGKDLVAKRGPAVLLTGFGPTAVGYFVQGGSKFAGYEFWKKKLTESYGGYEQAVPHRTAIYLIGASIAEFFADILLTPLEATRIRLVSDPTYANGLASGFARMAREGGIKEFYAGFIPILAKQVPYAVGQFAVNEWMHELVDKSMSKETQKNLSAPAKNGITLGCGIVAGCAAAVLSQPGDTLLSMINKGKGGSASVVVRLGQLAKAAGPAGLFAGLGPRIIMTAGLVSGQFWTYSIFKDMLGAPAGLEIHKAAK